MVDKVVQKQKQTWANGSEHAHLTAQELKQRHSKTKTGKLSFNPDDIGTYGKWEKPQLPPEGSDYFSISHSRGFWN